MKTIPYNNSLAKPDCCISYKSLTLLDYNNKMPDDELATILIDSTMLGMMAGKAKLAHKASAVR